MLNSNRSINNISSSISNDYKNSSIQSIKINHFSKDIKPIVSNDELSLLCDGLRNLFCYNLLYSTKI